MTFNRYVPFLALLALLNGCGERAKEEQTSMPPPAAEAAAPMADTAAAEVVAGETDAQTLYARSCASCHGATAEGVAGFPSLVGLSPELIRSRLQAYRAGENVGPKSAVMHPIAGKLSDEQIAVLASYLGS